MDIFNLNIDWKKVPFWKLYFLDPVVQGPGLGML
jgi:hypothetical protein